MARNLKINYQEFEEDTTKTFHRIKTGNIRSKFDLDNYMDKNSYQNKPNNRKKNKHQEQYN
jgi:hypothetical protein